MTLHLGYGTNGLTDLRLDDALGLLADLGYEGVGLTLDHMHLDPLAPDLTERTRQVRRRLTSLGLRVTVETGARYVLDPRRKHGPSLLDPDPDARAARTALLVRAVDVAAELGAHAVHCFSGITPPGTSPDTAWKRLTEALTPVLEAADRSGIPLAIEPEPGHLLATLADFHHLRGLLGDPGPLGLTLDIGHCQCLEEATPLECVKESAPGSGTSRSRTCGAESTSTSRSARGRSTSRPCSPPWPPRTTGASPSSNCPATPTRAPNWPAPPSTSCVTP